jgi:hypothetical protein
MRTANRTATRLWILSLLTAFVFALLFIPRANTHVLAQTDTPATEEATEEATLDATEASTSEADTARAQDATEEADETAEGTDEANAMSTADATDDATEEATDEATAESTEALEPVLVITEESGTAEPAGAADSGQTGEGEVNAVESGEEAEGNEQAALGRLMLVLGVLAIGVTGVMMIMRERNEAETAS